MIIDSVYVTNHALERWNERIGKATIKEIVEVLRRSRKIKRDNHVKEDDVIYTKSLEYDSIFVLSIININQYKLITVMRPKFATDLRDRKLPKRGSDVRPYKRTKNQYLTEDSY